MASELTDTSLTVNGNTVNGIESTLSSNNAMLATSSAVRAAITTASSNVSSYVDSAISGNIKFNLIWSTNQSELADVDISYIATDADFLALEYYMDGYARGGMSLISLDDYTGVYDITFFGSDTGDFATGSPIMWVRQLTGITRTGMHIGPAYGIYVRNNTTLTGFDYHIKPGKIYAAKIIN